MDFLFQKLLAICEKENPQSDFTSKFQFALDVLLPEVMCASLILCIVIFFLQQVYVQGLLKKSKITYEEAYKLYWFIINLITICKTLV